MTVHTHKAEDGTLVRCYHETANMLTSTNFWISTVIAFPLEHWLYEKGPLQFISGWLGL